MKHKFDTSSPKNAQRQHYKRKARAWGNLNGAMYIEVQFQDSGGLAGWEPFRRGHIYVSPSKRVEIVDVDIRLDVFLLPANPLHALLHVHTQRREIDGWQRRENVRKITEELFIGTDKQAMTPWTDGKHPPTDS